MFGARKKMLDKTQFKDEVQCLCKAYGNITGSKEGNAC